MKDKIGFLGTVSTSLCCLGIPAIVSMLTAIGLGFLINDVILLPLVVLFLALTVWGLYEGWKQHTDARPLLLGAIGAVLFIPSMFISPYLSGAILLLILSSTVWNTTAKRRVQCG